MVLPWTVTSPVVGSSKPATMRSSVDFPQPEAPIRQTNCFCTILRSMRASASISPWPTGNRLVTPRSPTSVCVSRMVLRAPAEDAIADHDNNAVGDEPACANDDHPRHHQVGARQRAAIHDDRTKPGGYSGHLADHN